MRSAFGRKSASPPKTRSAATAGHPPGRYAAMRGSSRTTRSQSLASHSGPDRRERLWTRRAPALEEVAIPRRDRGEVERLANDAGDVADGLGLKTWT